MTTARAAGNGIEGGKCWSLRLLGGFQLSLLPGGERVASLGKRERVLLAYLAITPNFRQTRRKLATLLWGDAADETSLDNLRTSLWRLRKAIGDSDQRFIASDTEDITLNATEFDIDTVTFHRLAALSGQADLEEAVKLYAGEFLDGLSIESEEFESWRRDEATRCRDQALDVHARLMSRWTEVGDTERAIELGLRILRLDRLHEPTVGRLMQLYNESGRRSAAVQLYRTLTETLRIELNAQPKAETRAVFAEIARGGEDRTSITPAADPKLLPLPAGKAPRSDARAARSQQASFAAGNAGRARISIAVLPFANMSGDLGQEFFCDGITEEMTTTLAKVPGLVVIGRTSAFKFKGQSRDLCSIGRALRSTHLMEGSVRKAGNRVRISAQLIDAANGTHLWAENYEADLTDIFAVQQDIARSIAGALQAPLGLKPGEHQVSHRIDHVNYQQYLRAKALVRARGLTNLTAAAALLERVVSSDPNFAPAWALMAQAYDLTPTCQPPGKDSANQLRRVAGAYLPRAEEAARRAIQLDAYHADGHLSLGFTHQLRGELLQAEALFKQALALDPNNSDVLHYYSQLLIEVGRLNEALAMRQRLHAQEPFVPTYNGVTGALLLVCGQDDASNRMLSGLSPDFPFRAACLARNYAFAGRYGEASDALLEAPSGTYLPRHVDKAVHLLRTTAASDSPQTLPQTLNFVCLHTVAPDSVLAYFEDSVEAGYLVSASTIDLWHPIYAPVRKTERFKAFARKAGLVDYWRANGWPEFCPPAAGDDFLCE